MTRKEFIKACSLLGISLPFYPYISSSHKYFDKTPNEKVIIIGAGAAGLSVAYLLNQQGVDFTILEASSQVGGRMKINNSFADFPISLGAEWLSSNHIQFGGLVNAKEAAKRIKTINYLPTDEYSIWDEGKLIRGTLDTFNDKKFVNDSWFGFFEKLILPSVRNSIKYNTVVKSIDYSENHISINTNKKKYLAEKVILTVPTSILKSGDINFTPALPRRKTKALEDLVYWDGFKAFFEFNKRFYPSFVDYRIRPETDGQVSFYDASYGQNKEKHILGLFSVGAPAKDYGKLNNDEFKRKVLNELDQMFDGKASDSYMKHISQNWSAEPFSKGAYVSDYTKPKTIKQLQKPVNNQLFFAGDAYTNGADWGNVHNAIHSAQNCVHTMLKNI
jgi:monoamine oxidase